MSSADPCDGCHECGLRCTAGVQMAVDEFERIVGHLRKADPERAHRVLGQDKSRPWFEGISVQPCLFYDTARPGCIVYPVRPLICRLFGHVEWLPCPLGKELPQLRGGLELIQTYANERRATFPEWCVEIGVFDPRQIVRPPL